MSAKKVIVVGNAKTGKTFAIHSLLKLNVTDPGQENHYVLQPYTPSFGVDVYDYVSPSGQKYNIWDCAGQLKNRGLDQGYYFNADIVIICTGLYEKNNPTSYGNKSVIEWKKDVKEITDGKITVVKNVTGNKLAAILI